MITVEWDNPEKTVLLMTFHPGWTWQDIYDASDEAYGFVDSVDHTVHILVDLSSVDNIAKGLNIVRLKSVTDHIRPNTGKVVLYGAKTLFGNMAKTLITIFDLKKVLDVAPDAEKARTMLLEHENNSL